MSTGKLVALSVLVVALAFVLPPFTYGLVTGDETAPSWLRGATYILVLLAIVGVFVAVLDRRRA